MCERSTHKMLLATNNPSQGHSFCGFGCVCFYPADALRPSCLQAPQPLVRPSSAHEPRSSACALASPSLHRNHDSEGASHDAGAVSHPVDTCSIPRKVIEQHPEPEGNQPSVAARHSRARPQSAGPASSTPARAVGACSPQRNPKQVSLSSHHISPLARPASARGSRGATCVGTGVVETGAAAVSREPRVQSIRCALGSSHGLSASADKHDAFAPPQLASSKGIAPRVRLPNRPLSAHSGSKRQPIVGGGSRPEYIPEALTSTNRIGMFGIPLQGTLRWDSQAESPKDTAGFGLDQQHMPQSKNASTPNRMVSMDPTPTFSSSQDRNLGQALPCSKSKGAVQIASAKNNMQNMRVAVKTGHSQVGRPRTPTVAERMARRRSGPGRVPNSGSSARQASSDCRYQYDAVEYMDALSAGRGHP